MLQSDTIKDQMLKCYIEQIFSKYDTDNNGTLDVQQMTNFFNDLFRSLNIQLVVNEQQSQQAIKSIDANYDGKVDKNELFNAFKVMLNGPPQPPQQTVQPQPNMQNTSPYGQNQYPAQQGYNQNYYGNNYNGGYMNQPGYVPSGYMNQGQPGYMAGSNPYMNSSYNPYSNVGMGANQYMNGGNPYPQYGQNPYANQQFNNGQYMGYNNNQFKK